MKTTKRVNRIQSSPKPVPFVVSYAKEHWKDILYISSAVIGLVCTADSYFYSGKDVYEMRLKQWEIVQELRKTDRNVFALVKDLDAKVEMNAKTIQNLENEIRDIRASITSIKASEYP